MSKQRPQNQIRIIQALRVTTQAKEEETLLSQKESKTLIFK